MKTRICVVGVLCATMLLGTVGFAAPRAVDENSNTTNPTSIADQIQRKLAGLPWYGVFDILAFQVNGTEVTLTGQLISIHDQTKYQAEDAVKAIPGVTKVTNDIQVLPPSPMDARIRRVEYRAIFSTGDLGRYSMGAIPQIHIIVNGGHVTLEGSVMNQMDRNMAEIAAKTVPGVFSVQNNLQVAG